jgi:hypothetical protein
VDIAVIARSASDEAIQFPHVDCFVEPVIGRRFAPTRWLAMTMRMSPRYNKSVLNFVSGAFRIEFAFNGIHRQ